MCISPGDQLWCGKISLPEVVACNKKGLFFAHDTVHSGSAVVTPCLLHLGTKAFSAASLWTKTSHYVIVAQRKNEKKYIFIYTYVHKHTHIHTHTNMPVHRHLHVCVYVYSVHNNKVSLQQSNKTIASGSIKKQRDQMCLNSVRCWSWLAMLT